MVQPGKAERVSHKDSILAEAEIYDDAGPLSPPNDSSFIGQASANNEMCHITKN